MGILSRLAGLFSLRKIWGPALTLLGVLGQAFYWGWRILDPLSRLDVLWRVVETMGGSTAMIASIISSWQFSLALIALGVGYTVFVGEPEHGTQRHAWWPYVAASVFFICLATMGSVAIYGAYELQLRRTYDEGKAGIPRGAPGENNPNRPQRPLFAGTNTYDLSPDQIRILIQEIPKLKTLIRVANFSRAPNDNIAYSLWLQYQDVFVRSGVPPVLMNQDPRGPEEEGLMIAVRNPKDMPVSAQKIIEAFEIANIRLRPIQMPTGLERPDIEFIIFLGPRPISWN